MIHGVSSYHLGTRNLSQHMPLQIRRDIRQEYVVGAMLIGQQVRSEVREHIEREADRVTHVHVRSEEHTSELQSRSDLVCRLLLEKKKKKKINLLYKIIKDKKLIISIR